VGVDSGGGCVGSLFVSARRSGYSDGPSKTWLVGTLSVPMDSSSSLPSRSRIRQV